MTLLKKMAYTFIVTCTISPAFAIYNVPFENINLNPNQSLQATYTFGERPIIFCYENNQQTVGIMSWTYKGVAKTSTLSTPLITNGNYEGFYANASGLITITNNQSYALIVSCLYGF